MKTKKFFYPALFLITFLSVTNVHGQVDFLLLGGFNSSKIISEFDNKEIIMSEIKAHYNLGAGFRFGLGKVLYLQPEVYVTRKGGLEQAFRPNPSDSIKQTANVQSIDVPLMLGVRVYESETKNFALRLYGGPVVSFLQDFDINVIENGQLVPMETIKEKMNVFSVQAGAGMDIFRFTFDVRYEYAMSPMMSFSDVQTRYKIIYLTVGLKLF